MVGYGSSSEANLRNFRHNFGEQDFSGKTRDYVAEQVGFELTVRSPKFAFDFSTEFPASLAEFGFRENFAPEVLNETIRLVSAVRVRVAVRGGAGKVHSLAGTRR